MINTDKIVLAWQIVEKFHSGQIYGGKGKQETPYIYHLGQVFIEASLAMEFEDDINRELLLVVSIMHDILEDTIISEEEILEKFGIEVLESIKALTKNEALDKNDQMSDSLDRIVHTNKETALVKLCDRISNLSRTPPSHWKKDWIKNYADEAEMINNQLRWSSRYLSKRLKLKIDFYRTSYL